MYSDVVHRTQIYLDDAEISALNSASARTGASRSELIRRAVRELYGAEGSRSRADALKLSAGAWRGRRLSGSEYVDSIRGDVNDRLARLRKP